MGFGFEKYLETLAVNLMDVATVILYCDISLWRHLDHYVTSIPFAPELPFPNNLTLELKSRTLSPILNSLYKIFLLCHFFVLSLWSLAL